MSALEILLLRHAQSQGNEEGRFGGHGPTPLTAHGRAQAELTAKALAREGGITAILSSDLVRAVQTAHAVSQATSVDVVTTTELRERSVGIFTGLTFSEAETRHPEAYAAMMRRDPNACPPDGETAWQCASRAGACLDRVVLKHRAGRVLFVSHAFTINLMLRRLFGVDDSQFFQTDNAALHRLKRRRDGGWTVVALNDRAHLVSAPAAVSYFSDEPPSRPIETEQAARHGLAADGSPRSARLIDDTDVRTNPLNRASAEEFDSPPTQADPPRR